MLDLDVVGAGVSLSKLKIYVTALLCADKQVERDSFLVRRLPTTVDCLYYGQAHKFVPDPIQLSYLSPL